jgi:hypothetical protein
MSQDSFPQVQITSARDLTALCEIEDYKTGAVLCTIFTFVDVRHTVWFGQIVGVWKYSLPVEI